MLHRIRSIEEYFTKFLRYLDLHAMCNFVSDYDIFYDLTLQNRICEYER